MPYLTPSTGLLGSPKVYKKQSGSQKLKRYEKGITVDCLINPDIKVGSEVKVTSKSFDDHYVVTEMKISADTQEGSWKMSLTCINEWV